MTNINEVLCKILDIIGDIEAICTLRNLNHGSILIKFWDKILLIIKTNLLVQCMVSLTEATKEWTRSILNSWRARRFCQKIDMEKWGKGKRKFYVGWTIDSKRRGRDGIMNINNKLMQLYFISNTNSIDAFDANVNWGGQVWTLEVKNRTRTRLVKARLCRNLNDSRPRGVSMEIID